MTLTAPIPLPVHDLRTAILTGLHPITATVHLPAAAFGHSTQQTFRQLEGAQTTARTALERNLEPAGLTIPDGTLDWALTRDAHGDGWTLTVVWRPRA